MNDLVLFLHFFILFLVGIAGVYMGLFAYRVLQSKQKIEILVPPPIKMLLTANVILIVFAVFFVAFLTLFYYMGIT